MFKRHVYNQVQKALSRSPVVLLNGARQTGKTTLALEFAKEKNYSYYTFDDEITLLTAKANISGFIAELPKPVILDEVQRLPEIFLAIKKEVDRNRIPGNYFLTGSANPLLIPRMGDSLAGRMEIINMMPLSQGEIYGKEEKFIDHVFNRKELYTPNTALTKKELYTRILKGGYPTVQHLNEEDQNAWIRSYLSLILQRDIRDLSNIEKMTEFPNLLRILAAHVSGLLNVASLSRDSRIPNKTLDRYLSLLETIFLVSLQPSWQANYALRFIKSQKINFVDTGLLSYLLQINLERVINDQVLIGKMLENFVVMELKKQSTWNTTEINMYHFRTNTGEEVDIVLENLAGEIVAIEIKNSATVTSADCKGLRILQDKVGNKFIKGIVLYTGSQYLPFDEKVCILPINALWELNQ